MQTNTYYGKFLRQQMVVRQTIALMVQSVQKILGQIKQKTIPGDTNGVLSIIMIMDEGIHQ